MGDVLRHNTWQAVVVNLDIDEIKLPVDFDLPKLVPKDQDRLLAKIKSAAPIFDPNFAKNPRLDLAFPGQLFSLCCLFLSDWIGLN